MKAMSSITDEEIEHALGQLAQYHTADPLVKNASRELYRATLRFRAEGRSEEEITHIISEAILEECFDEQEPGLWVFRTEQERPN